VNQAVRASAKDILDFIVIGAQKAGTTALFEYLRRHPELSLPPAKEVPYFSHNGRYSEDWHEYLRKAFPFSEDICLLVIQRRRTLPKELRRLLRRLRFDSRIQVRRDVRNDELVALYNRAEALVFPSLYEGFGLPVLEAMACGCPVICSNVTSLPEVAGKAALFVEPKDEEAIAEAIRRIVEDDNLRQSLAQKGVQRAALFDWRKTVVETVLVYREIASWLPNIKLAL